MTGWQDGLVVRDEGGVLWGPARWRVVRRVGWSLVIHPASDVVLITTDHTSAIAYADRLARQEQ